ncbi:hypothetical protein [Corynebacterium aquatimens]|uniref:VWFA domain-containing protein n=1 Tax=Corynebacterium aquatimens TaxID=1190508 RepID=A0A931GWP8_9CORY|nr:hypothetical protein [Corynebacterium aquatimens]MBG6122896.1 hypothetical protein [Corynebacterium aquatimens]WJY66769.1 hypothetical protein CAQUA_10410 [Corynebacterium aquatimens]
MAFLEQGNSKVLRGSEFRLELDISVTPSVPITTELTGAGQTVERGTTVFARGLSGEGALTIRPAQGGSFGDEVYVAVTLVAHPQTGAPESVELPRYRISGMPDFTPVSFRLTGEGLEVAAGTVEKLADAEEQVYVDIRRDIEAHGEMPQDTQPLSVLIYVDQSSSMGYPVLEGKLKDAATFLAQVLSQSRIALTVTGSSADARFVSVRDSKETAEEIQSLTAKKEIGWPNPLSAALNRYDKAVVITDGVPAEADDDRVFLFNLRRAIFNEEFNGMELTDAFQQAIHNKDQAKLSRMANFLTEELFGLGAGE